jgi:hypothetical protein
MQKKYALLTLFLVAVFATLNVSKVNSKITSPPAGSAGDPFAGGATCVQSGCHAGPAQTSTSSNLNLTIGTGNPTTPLTSSFQYTPGQQYNIGFSILTSATTNPFYGFQIVALNGSDARAGTMAVTNAATTKINNIGTGATARQYMGHQNANSTRNWTFKWTAPAASTGPVTFYYTFNVCNASSANPNNPEGTIYKSSVTIPEGTGSGIEDISSKISALNIFPNPVTNEFGLSFDLAETNRVSSQLFSLDGQLLKELINAKTEQGHFTESFNVRDLPAGIYMVKLNVGEASVTKKIIKQ